MRSWIIVGVPLTTVRYNLHIQFKIPRQFLLSCVALINATINPSKTPRTAEHTAMIIVEHTDDTTDDNDAQKRNANHHVSPIEEHVDSNLVVLFEAENPTECEDADADHYQSQKYPFDDFAIC